MSLTKADIVAGLVGLGVRPGMVLMAHADLTALGEVEGGAATVVEALIEAVGREGTLAMPAFSERGEVFHRETSPVTNGPVAEAFRRREGVLRSVHPTHSVCAAGPAARELIARHLEETSPVGNGSPWGRLAALSAGHVLLLGVTQNANTLLYLAEDAVDAPYLQTVVAEYHDPGTGQTKSKQICRFPEGHRDFLSLNRLFLDTGVLRRGRIGGAACGLLHAGRALELTLAALRRDVTALLCTSPRCVDCLRCRAAVRRARLGEEAFTLTAVADDVNPQAGGLVDSLSVLARQGVVDVEFGAALVRALVEGGEHAQLDAAAALAEAGARLHSVEWELPSDKWSGDEGPALGALAVAERLGARKLVLSPLPAEGAEAPAEDWVAGAGKFLDALRPASEAAEVAVLIENRPGTPLATGAGCAALLRSLAPGTASLALNPAHLAQAGEQPVFGVYDNEGLGNLVGQLYACDGCGQDAPQQQDYTLLGEGQGQIKELLARLRCRSFAGSVCIRGGWGKGEGAVVAQCKAFWRLMDGL